MGVVTIANINTLSVTLIGHTTGFLCTLKPFLLNLTDSLHLQFTQVLRSPDLMSFVSTMTTTTEPIALPLAHVCGVKKTTTNQNSASLGNRPLQVAQYFPILVVSSIACVCGSRLFLIIHYHWMW